MKSKPLNEKEWDFTRIPPNEFRRAIAYEYFREDPTAVKKVRKWYSKPIPGWSGNFDPCNGNHDFRWEESSVITPIIAMRKNGYRWWKLPLPVRNLIKETCPFRFELWFFALPSPWDRIPKALKNRQIPFEEVQDSDLPAKALRQIHPVEDWEYHRKIMGGSDETFIPMPSPEGRQWLGRATAPHSTKGFFLFEIDFSLPESAIVEELKQWLRKQQIDSLRVEKRGQNREEQPESLGQLAALRLVNSGCKLKDVRKKCASILEKRELDAEHARVLPYYNSKKALENAVSKAKKLRDRLMAAYDRPPIILKNIEG